MARERLRENLRKSLHGWNRIFLLGREGEGGKSIGVGGRDNGLSKRRRNANGSLLREMPGAGVGLVCVGWGPVEALI